MCCNYCWWGWWFLWFICWSMVFQQVSFFCLVPSVVIWFTWLVGICLWFLCVAVASFLDESTFIFCPVFQTSLVQWWRCISVLNCEFIFLYSFRCILFLLRRLLQTFAHLVLKVYLRFGNVDVFEVMEIKKCGWHIQEIEIQTSNSSHFKRYFGCFAAQHGYNNIVQSLRQNGTYHK